MLFKKLLAILLSAVMVILCVPLGAVNTKAIDIEKVYNSDLFWSYPEYLNDSDYLNTYVQENMTAFDNTYYDYINSSRFILTSIKEGLTNVLSLEEWIKLINDGYHALKDDEEEGGYTQSFYYQDALDLGNEIFAKHLLGVGNSFGDALGVGSEHVEIVSNLVELVETFKIWYETGSFTYEEALTKVFVLLGETDLVKNLSKNDLDSIANYCKKANNMSNLISTCGTVLEVCQALMTAITMENMRAGALDLILAAGPTGSLSQGMSRLENQLSMGFVSYFIHNYLTEKLIGEVSDKIVSAMGDAAVGSAGIMTVISLIIDISAFVVFDVVIPTNDMVDITTQYVLTNYVYEMKSLIDSKEATFCKRFTLQDVKDYQALYSALKAAVDAGIEASMEIASDGVKPSLKAVASRYEKHDIFEKTINDLNKKINEIPKIERKRFFHDEWLIYNATDFSFGADKLVDDVLYLTDSEFNGNIRVKILNTPSDVTNLLTIPQDSSVTVNGYFISEFTNLCVKNLGKLEIKGDFQPDNYQSEGEATQLIVDGNFFGDINLEGNSKVTIGGNFQTEDAIISKETVLTVGGDYSVQRCTGGGTVVLSGDEEQIIHGLNAQNVYVLNPQGIRYSTSAYISGRYELNGSPLNNVNPYGNTQYTYYWGDVLDLDSVSDYKTVYVKDSCVLDREITADLLLSIENSSNENPGYLTIPSGVKAKVNGSIGSHFSYYEVVKNLGELTVTGEFRPVKYTTDGNPSKLCVGGVINTQIDSAEGSVIEVKGDYFSGGKNKGTTILSGTEKAQNLSGLDTHNLSVTNPNGIVYASNVHISGRYELNGNPVSLVNEYGNQNYAYYYGEVLDVDSISDYKKIYISNSCILDREITADLELKNDTSSEQIIITIPEKSVAKVNGNFNYYYSNINEVKNLGELTVTGEFRAAKYTTDGNPSKLCVGGAIYTQIDSAEGSVIEVKGDYYSGGTNRGTTILSGTEKVQNISGLDTHNLFVTNPKGIIYVSKANVSGRYELNGNPINSKDGYNYYEPVCYTGSVLDLDSVSDYKSICIENSCVIDREITADLELKNDTSSEQIIITIPEKSVAKVNGNFSYYYSNINEVKNLGEFTVTGEFRATKYTTDGNPSKLTIGGNYYSYNEDGVGTIVFNGTAQQSIGTANFDTIIIENSSAQGVSFQSPISPSRLFEHNGNKFTLNNGGYDCVFADFDGDRMTDEVDPLPQVFDTKYYHEDISDINTDGKADLLDLIKAKKIMLKGGYNEQVDLNGDKSINALDLGVILQVLLGIFPLVK